MKNLCKQLEEIRGTVALSSLSRSMVRMGQISSAETTIREGQKAAETCAVLARWRVPARDDEFTLRLLVDGPPAGSTAAAALGGEAVQVPLPRSTPPGLAFPGGSHAAWSAGQGLCLWFSSQANFRRLGRGGRVPSDVGRKTSVPKTYRSCSSKTGRHFRRLPSAQRSRQELFVSGRLSA